MKVLVKFVLKMDKFGVYHSDLKNPNIVVVFDDLGNAVIKVIDLGGVSFNFAIIEAYSRFYMPSVASAIDKCD